MNLTQQWRVVIIIQIFGRLQRVQLSKIYNIIRMPHGCAINLVRAADDVTLNRRLPTDRTTTRGVILYIINCNHVSISLFFSASRLKVVSLRSHNLSTQFASLRPSLLEGDRC